MCSCKLNIHGSIVNESHLSNFRNNSQKQTNKKTILFTWTVTSRIPRFQSSQNQGSIFRPHPVHQQPYGVCSPSGKRPPRASEYVTYGHIAPSLFRGSDMYSFFSDWQLDFNISSNLVSQPILINPCSVSVITYGAHKNSLILKM